MIKRSLNFSYHYHCTILEFLSSLYLFTKPIYFHVSCYSERTILYIVIVFVKSVIV